MPEKTRVNLYLEADLARRVDDWSRKRGVKEKRTISRTGAIHRLLEAGLKAEKGSK